MSGGPVSSNTPSGLEVIKQIIGNELADLHTCMPGTVKSYNGDTQTAEIELGFKRKYTNEVDAVAYPVILDVPVIFPTAGGARLRFPMLPGDEVLVLFAERSIDTWIQLGGQQDPLLPRRFSINDAVAIPGLRSNKSIIRPSGKIASVELSMGNSSLEINKDGRIALGNQTVEVLHLLNDLVTALTTVPALAPISAQLATILAKLLTIQVIP